METSVILQIGRVQFDGLRTLGLAHGYKIVNRGIMSSTDLDRYVRWLETGTVNRRYGIAYAVFGLAERVLLEWTRPEHFSKFMKLVDLLKNYKHSIYVYEPNLNGVFPLLFKDQTAAGVEDFYSDEWFGQRAREQIQQSGVKPQDAAETARRFLQSLYVNGLNVHSYKTWTDALVLAYRHTQEVFEGRSFEVYVSRQRALSDEFDKFMGLFCKYMAIVKGVDIRHQKEEVTGSVVYRFQSKDLEEEGFTKAMDEFKGFLVLAEASPESILSLIERSGLPDKEVSRLAKGFHWDWLRLKLDIETRLKEKVLELQSTYQNRILNARVQQDMPELPVNVPVGDPTKFFPGAMDVGNVLSLDAYRKQPNELGQNSTFSLGSVAQSVFGLNFRDEDTEILALIDQMAEESEKPRLQNQLELLNDVNVSAQDRLMAYQGVSRFFYRHLPLLGQAKVNRLLEMLDHKASM